MKNRCGRVQEKLAELAAGNPAGIDGGRILRHVRGCAACTRALAAEQRLSEELRSLPLLECPESVTRAVLEATRRKKSPHGAFERALGAVRTVLSHRALKPALACALVLFASLFLVQRHRQSAPPVKTFTEDEISRAREIMEWGLVYSAGQVQKSEQRVFRDVVTVRVPEAIERSVLSVYDKTTGGGILEKTGIK
jgi:hypothetical protein